MKPQTKDRLPKNGFRTLARRYWWTLIPVLIFGGMFAYPYIIETILLHKFDVAYEQLEKVGESIDGTKVGKPTKACSTSYGGFVSTVECRVNIKIPTQDKDYLKDIALRSLDYAGFKSVQLRGDNDSGSAGFVSDSGIHCSMSWSVRRFNDEYPGISAVCLNGSPHYLPGFEVDD